MKNILSNYIKIFLTGLVVFILSPMSFGQGIGFTVQAESPGVAGVSFLLNAKIIDELKLEGKYGFVIGTDEYTGLDGIVNILYYPKHPVYFIAGITNHWNSGVSAISTHIADGSFILGGIGVGVDLTKAFSLELVYSTPLQNYNWRGTWNYEEQKIKWSSMEDVIRFDFKFHWDMW